MASCFSCFKNKKNDDDNAVNDDDESDDESSNTLMWQKELGKYSCGEFSFAVVQGSRVMEDQSQVEIGRKDAIFVGVYDGHGGDRVSKFINDNLFDYLISLVTVLALENGTITISEEILKDAVSATEDAFVTEVERNFYKEPNIVTVGSCCLVGLIWKGTLYIANVGDSRAVIGSIDPSNKIIAEQLTTEHSVSREEIRQELKALHPEDSDIVFKTNGIWRVKGIIHVSRSIGDIQVKRRGFSAANLHRLREPTGVPWITAEPFLSSRVLQPNDRFLIFASDGLWEHMTSQEAAEIVHNNPRPGIARRLVKAALKVAARKNNMKYKELQKIVEGRRDIHDDITVIVVFIDHELLGKNVSVPELSIKGFTDLELSIFRYIEELM